MDCVNRTEMNDVFYRYIPKFAYELVNQNNYNEEDLVQFGDTLSFVMLIDKIKTADSMSMLSKLPSDYVEKLQLRKLLLTLNQEYPSFYLLKNRRYIIGQHRI